MNTTEPVVVEFDQNNYNWAIAMPMEYNLIFLRQVQTFLNQRLLAQGHLFLNEALDALGLKRTPLGATHGWIGEYAYVDFGIFGDDLTPSSMGQYDKSIPLKLNITGEIYKDI